MRLPKYMCNFRFFAVQLSLFKQIQMFLWYDVQIHTNVQYVHIHTDTACVQHVNVGLAHSLIPSPSLQLSPVAVWILSIIRTASDNSCGYSSLRLGPMPKKWSGQTGLTDRLLLLWCWLSEKPSCTKISTCGPQLITVKNLRNSTHQIIIIYIKKLQFNSLMWGSLTLAPN